MKCAVKDPFVRTYEFQINPRQTALEKIVEYFPHHSKTKDLLIDRMNNDPDKQVRKFAQQALEKSTD